MLKDMFKRLLGTGPLSVAMGTIFGNDGPVTVRLLISKGAPIGIAFEVVTQSTFTLFIPLIVFVEIEVAVALVAVQVLPLTVNANVCGTLVLTSVVDKSRPIFTPLT